MKTLDSTHTIRPKAVDDVSSWILFEKKEGNIFCIGSLKQDSYIEASKQSCNGIMTALQYFNGMYTLDEIGKQLFNNHNIKIDVIKLYNLLSKASLLENGDKSLQEKQELDILSIKLFEADVTKLGRILSLLVKVIFPFGLIVSLPLLLLGTIAIIKSISIFITPHSYQIAHSYLLGVIVSSFIFSFSIGLHELAHMVVAYKYGLIPSKLIFALYMGIIPMIYIKIPGIYTVEPQKRIRIWAAGCFVNLNLACLMILIQPLVNTNLSNLFVMMTIVNTGMVITNLSPFMPLDGYFIVSTILKKPNLRRGAFREFKKFAFREKNNFKGTLLLYFVISTLFMVFILFSQFAWVTKLVVDTYSNSHSIFQVFWELKFIGITILILIIKQNFSRILKNRNLNKNSTPSN
jgi:Zn-dependent proteases